MPRTWMDELTSAMLPDGICRAIAEAIGTDNLSITFCVSRHSISPSWTISIPPRGSATSTTTPLAFGICRSQRSWKSCTWNTMLRSRKRRRSTRLCRYPLLGSPLVQLPCGSYPIWAFSFGKIDGKLYQNRRTAAAGDDAGGAGGICLSAGKRL